MDIEAGSSTTNNINNVDTKNVTVVTDLDSYAGKTLEGKLDSFVQTHPVAMISKTWCPFSRDAKDLLGHQMGVLVHAVEVNTHPDGAAIFQYLSTKYDHHTVPIVFIRGQYIGGCDDTKALHQSGALEQVHLQGLTTRPRTTNTDKIETARLAPLERSEAVHPPFWFPNTVNNYVVRLTGLQVFCLSALSAAFHYTIWGRYLAVGLLVDFSLRLIAGSGLSPLGMIATLLSSYYTPLFKPGPPKQFAAFCGVFFSLMGVIFYFLDFSHHDVVGAVWMGMLACAAGLEGFFDFCLGCVFFGYGIQFGLISDSVYRIYTASRQEVVDGWNYRFLNSNAPTPEFVDTNPASPIALKYKKKTAEWTKDDFDVVRHMQVTYFAMPLALAGLAVALKIATDWANPFRAQDQARSILVPEAWSFVVGAVAGVVFAVFAMLYTYRLVVASNKCKAEWDCPLRSNGFGMISITLMLGSFLLYDEINEPTDSGAGEENPQLVARILWWVGALFHACLTFAKFGEWVGRRLELEHIHPQWMILPVGLAVAALTAPLIGVFEEANQYSKGNLFVARFFYAFAWLMWLTLFTITFFKVVTEHNSDDRIRHGVFIWIAAPCILGLANFAICAQERLYPQDVCIAEFSQMYFMGLFIFFGLIYATLPHLNFFGRDGFNMGYWTECFALDTLAACAAMFYAVTGWQFSQTVQFLLLTMASIANMTALLHTIVAMIRKRGVFTPEAKWGPLSFMVLTHEAFRGNLQTLRHYIDVASVEDTSPTGRENLGLFAAHLNRFCILHEEHAKHEDQVIFKTFNDFFPEHARKWNDDHAQDHLLLETWRKLANQTLDITLPVSKRKAALDELRADLPAFFAHFEEHLRGEEENLQPIGRKILPIAIMKDISRQVWELTSAERWEIIVPFIVNNLPRHPQRVRYIKVLCWSMPERAQQIGAIIYRNVDAVFWERLRIEVPEMIPRGAPGWKRYY